MATSIHFLSGELNPFSTTPMYLKIQSFVLKALNPNITYAI